MEQAKLILTCLVICQATASAANNVRCHHTPESIDDERSTVLVIPLLCRSGLVDWRLPNGYLQLISEKLAGYSLCVQETWDSILSHVRIVNTHSDPPTFHSLTDQLLCVHDNFGHAEILILAYALFSDTVSFQYVTVYYDYSRRRRSVFKYDKHASTIPIDRIGQRLKYFEHNSTNNL